MRADWTCLSRGGYSINAAGRCFEGYPQGHLNVSEDECASRYLKPRYSAIIPNIVALDPWNGAEYVCLHVSSMQS